jgi:hypothetical protein
MKPGGLHSANQQALGVGALLCKKAFGVPVQKPLMMKLENMNA